MANPRPSSLILPMRADPRWGLHVLKDVNPAYPVGQSEQSEIDPTASYFYGPGSGIYIPTLEPPRTISSSITAGCDCGTGKTIALTLSATPGTGAGCFCTSWNTSWSLAYSATAPGDLATTSVTGFDKTAGCWWYQELSITPCTTSGSTYDKIMVVTQLLSAGSFSGTHYMYFRYHRSSGTPAWFSAASYTISHASLSCSGSSTWSRSLDSACGVPSMWPSTISPSIA